MKKHVILAGILFFGMTFVMAQEQPLKGQSMNGSTGLYSIPSGHIGWENSANLGIDLGYRAVINNSEGIAHIPAITASLFKWVELSLALDLQPEININGKNQKNDDLLLGLKVRMPTNMKNTSSTNIALGVNAQFINLGNDNYNYNAFQPYAAISYMGTFFKMNAETTVVFGKTFYSGGPDNNSDIDFGMGFDLILFPDVFKEAVHWIIDFANFSYSDNSWPNGLLAHTGSAWYRGIVNTGFRIDLSVFPGLNKFKFMVDLVFNDLFDDGQRSFTIGGVFGIPIK
ncbi:MAG: hypothetical protein LBH44_03580 [Treponema sp.]|jgi:hypothetical protein|nr:hypothetical protein [Treponema sp.]